MRPPDKEAPAGSEFGGRNDESTEEETASAFDATSEPLDLARFDRDAAATYLHAVFGREKGTAQLAIGYGPHRDDRGKYRHHDWSEIGFEWPDDLDGILDRVKHVLASTAADVYVRPYLAPDARVRRAKGNAVARRLIHADRDGTEPLVLPRSLPHLFAVDSGTPGHEHVYVPVDDDLTVEWHEALCRGLAAKVGQADAKISDNDVLRLPGTWNHKHDPPRPVAWIEHPTGAVGAPVELIASVLGVDFARPARKPSAAGDNKHSGKAAVDDLDLEGLPPPVRLALRTATGDRSEDTMRVVSACKRAGLDLDRTREVVDRRRDLGERLAGRRDDDVARCWERVEEDDQAETFDLDAEVPVESAWPLLTFEIEAEFWTARPELRRIRDWAWAREVAPWALLGCVVARLMAVVPHTVVLPPPPATAPLNMFVALVGGPESGKTSVKRVAREAVDLGAVVNELNLGSGEGIAHVYARRDSAGVHRTRYSALFKVGEVRKLEAMVDRKSSTLLAILCDAWSGEALGENNVDPTRSIPIAEMDYRICLLVDVQPENGGVLLTDAQSGTPQRFLWMPSTDPDAPEATPDQPDPWIWRPHVRILDRIGSADAFLLAGKTEVPICASAQGELRANRDRGRRGQKLLMDAHSGQQQLRVAVALAVLAGRAAVTDEDWRLAAVVMAVSHRTRRQVQRALGMETERRAKVTGRLEAVKADATEGARADLTDRKLKRIADNLRSKLNAADGRRMAGAALSRTLASRDRPHFDAAMALLLELGDVESSEIEYQGQSGTEWHWIEPS